MASVSDEETLNLLKRSTCNFDNPLPSTFDFLEELKRGRSYDYETFA